MKMSGRKQSKNIERYVGEPTEYETGMNLKRYYESEKAVPKKVDIDLERAAAADRVKSKSDRRRVALNVTYEVGENRRLKPRSKPGPVKR